MSTKNALLFCLSILGVLFIGAGPVFDMIGLGAYSPALYAVGGFLLTIFVALVLGVGFLLKLVYLAATVGVVSYAANYLADSNWILGAAFAAAAVVLIALIPTVFLRKK